MITVISIIRNVQIKILKSVIKKKTSYFSFKGYIKIITVLGVVAIATVVKAHSN